MKVEVCHGRIDGATRIAVDIDPGGTLGTAVDRSGIVALLSLDTSTLSFAIFGRRASRDTPLHDGDRVELLRPLLVDPKEARHRRAAKKRAQSTVR
ncbi:MAG: RnfH family protein [Burkholderiaceae bacterium]